MRRLTQRCGHRRIHVANVDIKSLVESARSVNPWLMSIDYESGGGTAILRLRVATTGR